MTQAEYAWLSSITAAEVADYIYDLLLGAESMAKAKGLDRLADFIAAAANEAAIQL